jgi:phage/plasmid-like protein (TIGR03299 family)
LGEKKEGGSRKTRANAGRAKRGKKMADNLNIGKNGQAAMMYVGEKPWHSLGKQLQEAATAAEAIEAAQLDWEVGKRPIYYPHTEGMKKVPEHFAVVREDNQMAIGVVGKKYEPMQNRDAFSFFDAIVGIKEAIYHTAGALGNGERVWILAKLPGYIRVKQNDITEKYLLLSNSHDGTSSIQIMFSPIRVVCQNTLNVAIKTAREKARIRHTVSLMTRVNEVRDQLGIINAQYSIMEDLANRMANVEMNKRSFEDFLVKSGVVPKDAEDRMQANAQKVLNEVTHLFEHGRGNDEKEVRGTLWAALSGVVEYADYAKAIRAKDGKEMDARARSVLFGTGQAMKQKAWDAAAQMVVEVGAR